MPSSAGSAARAAPGPPPQGPQAAREKNEKKEVSCLERAAELSTHCAHLQRAHTAPPSGGGRAAELAKHHTCYCQTRASKVSVCSAAQS